MSSFIQLVKTRRIPLLFSLLIASGFGASAFAQDEGPPVDAATPLDGSTETETVATDEQPVANEAADENKGLVQKLNDALAPVDGAFGDVNAVIGNNFIFYPIPLTAAQEDGTPGQSIPAAVLVLISGATFFTLRMKFVNVRAFKHAILVTAGKYDDPADAGEVTHFQALTAAL